MNKNIKDKEKNIKPKKDKGLYIYDFELGKIDISVPKSKAEVERREKELRKRIEYQNNLRKSPTTHTDERE